MLIAKRAEDGVELSLPVIPIDEEQPDHQPIIDTITQLTSLKKEDIVNVAAFTWTGLSIIVELQNKVDLGAAEIDGRGLVSFSYVLLVELMCRLHSMRG